MHLNKPNDLKSYLFVVITKINRLIGIWNIIHHQSKHGSLWKYSIFIIFQSVPWTISWKILYMMWNPIPHGRFPHVPQYQGFSKVSQLDWYWELPQNLGSISDWKITSNWVSSFGLSWLVYMGTYGAFCTIEKQTDNKWHPLPLLLRSTCANIGICPVPHISAKHDAKINIITAQCR